MLKPPNLRRSPFLPCFAVYFGSIWDSQRIRGMTARTARCVACACPAQWQPPRLGEWKDFSNFVCKLLTHRLYFSCPPPFSCIHNSSSQDPFSLLIRLGFLVYFSGPVPCKKQLYMREAKGVQYMSKTEAYIANGLCNFPCLSCLNLTRTKHSSNFFGMNPCD